VALVATAATDDCAPAAAAVALTVTATDVAAARSLRLHVITLPLVVHTAPASGQAMTTKP